MPRSRPYKTGLDERLKNAEYAASYLNAARRESNEVFLLALRDVAEAYKISRVASAARVNRETLYRTLSIKGNPTLSTLRNIEEVLGLEPEYRVKRHVNARALHKSHILGKDSRSQAKGPDVCTVSQSAALGGLSAVAFLPKDRHVSLQVPLPHIDIGLEEYTSIPAHIVNRLLSDSRNGVATSSLNR